MHDQLPNEIRFSPFFFLLIVYTESNVCVCFCLLQSLMLISHLLQNGGDSLSFQARTDFLFVNNNDVEFTLVQDQQMWGVDTRHTKTH